MAEAKTGVFWDMEDCPIPEGLDPGSVYRNIKSALANNGYGGEVTICAFGDKNQIPGYFESAGIELVRAGDKRARLLGMMNDFFSWVRQNRGAGSSNLMVISHDTSEFASCLDGLAEIGQRILLAQPRMTPRRCRKCRVNTASAEWLWETLAAGGDPIVIPKDPSHDHH
ncbi:unnamed protein product [Thlaspi arvense]|uniref:NYN domain-containing protein n=1 Tax=Thlaspi arvense TaxID=13288 RepID=A0AAU9SC78_THLAR|nr:unnamed protein product [Thlaspi arvense]